MEKLYWHFLNSEKRLQFGSKEIVRVKHTLTIPPNITPVLCTVGFHASERAIDALQYAPGPLICKVILHGKIVKDTNKVVAQGRTVLWMQDATSVLQDFSRWCALQVIHLWDAPKIVIDYLNTGNEQLRAAAWDAAWAAAGDAGDAARAARDAARDAAWAAARDAAWAARNAAWDAARAPAGDAAWDAARAAGAAAWDAARDARDAAWAAGDAARAAAWDAQNKQLEKMLNKLGPK